MAIIQMLLKEMDQEAQTTRKMLNRIPDDKYQWQPHVKSMTIAQLSNHIAELPTWITLVLNTTELDFATAPYKPTHVANTAELMELLEKSLADGRASLEKATDADLEPTWTLRNGNEIYSVSTKGEMIRTTFSQIVHHRAQLGVFLRLLNIPIPGSYGPSADDMSF
ncbi:putative damage-inducible protein DinB [Mucilaginibacter gracilis]|uniref:Putative damage-inducible protein DinB n=1 Tax=Mucilaginibacter gracilis TaxID=423350 RepID=A0A495IYS1_9SPHI|nr:DinB family protein [Mucilaginibacter gracilis]RKR81218.1 putative damage-inducible protein DinB [Mucilaginibacter gracilis]